MKKYLTLVFATLIFFMAACGGDSSSTNEDNKEDYEGKSSAEIQMEILEEQDGVEAKAEVTDIKYYKWLDEAVSTETITVYAEIKNTSDTNIDAGRVKITYLDYDGGVIAVNDAQISPRYLKEGSIGYVSAEIEGGIDKYEDLNNIEMEVSPIPFQDTDIIEFTTKNENLNVETWGEESAKISVTGFFENDSDINFTEDDTSAVIGIYDEDGNFLATESMYQGQGFSIDANNETSFEIAGGSPLPPEVGEKVDHAKVRAIGIKNMDDYWW